METGKITTPFGRRPMTLALVRRQIQTSGSKTGRTVDKWRVFRDAGDARSLLGLQDRALTVLNALLSFYPASELSEEKGLIVFPSNVQLSVRANGIAGTTLRKNLAALVDAGLIIRKDSPNGKRYARKGDGGTIEDAYGFSLAPLVARADELAAMAQQMELERRRFRMIKDRVSIARRDVRKLISAAIEEGASGDWGRAESCFADVVGRIPRRPTIVDLEAIADELALLHEEVVRMLESQLNSEESDANAIAYGCHIQNSNTESCNEFEPRFEKKQGENAVPSSSLGKPIQTFPLEMVLRGCPEIKPFGPGGSVANWRDLMAAAVSVRSMLGVSPSAYEEACEIMGQATAAAVIACIYERSGHINSAGGYLRDLTAKARRGEFSMGPMLMALIRGNTVAGRARA
jgi:replication initiation protein RepC